MFDKLKITDYLRDNDLFANVLTVASIIIYIYIGFGEF